MFGGMDKFKRISISHVFPSPRDPITLVMEAIRHPNHPLSRGLDVVENACQISVPAVIFKQLLGLRNLS